jgi:DNA-binding winged helix-turn-helix (wHTH) protein
MKVLAALVNRAGRVVSRGELFEVVWGSQIVGEDALTRCISDIRAELKKLSGRDDLIETLPKRGYRWRLEVREGDGLADRQRELDGTEAQSDVARAAPPRPRGRVVRFATRGLTYLLALVVMAIAGVWLADRLSRPGLLVVAVLPVAAGASQSDLEMRVENELTDRLMALGEVRLLSRSAVASRPENPFPFFYYEFGARWVIEAEVQHLSGRDVLMLAVVDARTGIVLTQRSEPIVTAPDGVADSISKSLRAIESLIGPGSAERR